MNQGLRTMYPALCQMYSKFTQSLAAWCSNSEMTGHLSHDSATLPIGCTSVTKNSR